MSEQEEINTFNNSPIFTADIAIYDFSKTAINEILVVINNYSILKEH